jgi:hypothetical protein
LEKALINVWTVFNMFFGGGQMVSYETHESEKWVLTEEGMDIASNGSHEVKVFQAIPADGSMTVAELEVICLVIIKLAFHCIHFSTAQSKLGASVTKIGQGKAFKNGWIQKEGKDSLRRKVGSIQDQTQSELNVIRDTGNHPDSHVLKELKKRKLCDKRWLDVCYQGSSSIWLTLFQQSDSLLGQKRPPFFSKLEEASDRCDF